MIGFALAEPRTMDEALRLLDPADPAVRPVGGGTAVMLMMKSGLYRPSRLVSLRRIEARYQTHRGGCRRQPAHRRDAPFSATWNGPSSVAQHAPVIARTLRTLSNVRVRNQATVGGHLAHADPHMDLPPVLAALGASVTIASPRGVRTVAVVDLYAGYLETVLGNDELIAELVVPSQDGARAAYAKVTARSADDWPSVGIAVSHWRQGRAPRLRRRGDGDADAAEVGGGYPRRRHRRRRASSARARPPPRRQSPSPTSTARPPTSASSSACICARAVARRAEREARDGGRTIAAARRGARQGHRPGRVRAPSAPARHGSRQDPPRRPSRTGGSSRSTLRRRRRSPASRTSITGADIEKMIPHPYFGPAFHDMPILALGKVRFAGEPVAVALAADPHVVGRGGAADHRRIRAAARRL